MFVNNQHQLTQTLDCLIVLVVDADSIGVVVVRDCCCCCRRWYCLSTWTSRCLTVSGSMNLSSRHSGVRSATQVTYDARTSCTSRTKWRSTWIVVRYSQYVSQSVQQHSGNQSFIHSKSFSQSVSMSVNQYVNQLVIQFKSIVKMSFSHSMSIRQDARHLQEEKRLYRNDQPVSQIVS